MGRRISVLSTDSNCVLAFALTSERVVNKYQSFVELGWAGAYNRT